MLQTVEKKFPHAALPTWARRHAEVVDLACRSLAYRCDICAAETVQWHCILLRQTRLYD